MFWLIIAFVIPIIVAWNDGSTYTFAISISVAGLLAFIVNNVLIQFFISRRAPTSLSDGTWENTAGKGVVPKWVSFLGVVGAGFVPSGMVVALLLFLGVVENSA